MPASTEQTHEQKDLSWDDVMPVDIIGLEVGYQLIPLVDRNQGGELLNRIKGCARSSPRSWVFWCLRCISATTWIRPEPISHHLDGSQYRRGQCLP